MLPTILIVYPIPIEGLADLKKVANLIYPTENDAFSKSEIIDRIPNCDGLLSVFNQAVDSDIIKAGTKLKIIANYGVGYNNINVRLAAQKGIMVCNTPDPVTAPTAELAFSLLLNLFRKTSIFERALRSGTYTNWNMLGTLGNSLQGKTLGIIGLGKIGKAVAHKANAFGMRVGYYQRRRLPGLEERSWNVYYQNFDSILQDSDVISLHMPLTPQTHHMIGADELQLMKNSAYLINTARGAVVDEKALLQALTTKQIAGAGLDVFEKEPEITTGLLELDNVIAVPHIGTQTIETRIDMGKQAAQNLIDFFSGRLPKNRVC